MTTVSEYILKRLKELGINHIFGVPGDYVLTFMDRIVESPIKLVGTCNELNAGYATDAYARVNGIGCAVVTYGVGGLSIVNAVAGAYAEQIPMIVISGAPHRKQKHKRVLVHHLTKDYNLQYDIYKKITVDAVQINNPNCACWLIERAINNCLFHKRPVYIELPIDMVDVPCPVMAHMPVNNKRVSDQTALEEALLEAAELMNEASHPAILVGMEIHRFNLKQSTLDLIERIELPFATTINTKSVLPELHPQFIGVYQGGFSHEYVRKQIEDADALLALGVWINDFNSGGFTAHIDDHSLIHINSEYLKIKHHFYHDVWMGDFISQLTAHLKPRPYGISHPDKPHATKEQYVSDPDAPITVRRFYDRLNCFMEDDMILIAETGDSICAAPFLDINEPENFIAQAYYLSIGYALPATLGVALAKPEKRPILLEGDGAFQMTVQELSTILRQNCHPAIFLINNQGYVIERVIHDGPYNDIQNWQYHRLPEVFGDNVVCLKVDTENDLEAALTTIHENPDKAVFVEVCFDRNDCSEGLFEVGRKVRELSKD